MSNATSTITIIDYTILAHGEKKTTTITTPTTDRWMRTLPNFKRVNRLRNPQGLFVKATPTGCTDEDGEMMPNYAVYAASGKLVADFDFDLALAEESIAWAQRAL